MVMNRARTFMHLQLNRNLSKYTIFFKTFVVKDSIFLERFFCIICHFLVQWHIIDYKNVI